MDPYCYPDSIVLRNNAELHDSEQLRAHEARLVFKRLIQLYDESWEGGFDLAHLLQIHRELFQDVYPWAGQMRSGELSLGAQRFCRSAHLERNLTSLLLNLAREDHLRGLDADQFAHRAGFYLNELNAIHPFRDGNGRTQREFLRELGIAAGHKLRWAHISQFEMYNASKLSMATRNPVGLVSVMRKALSSATTR